MHGYITCITKTPITLQWITSIENLGQILYRIWIFYAYENINLLREKEDKNMAIYFCSFYYYFIYILFLFCYDIILLGISAWSGNQNFEIRWKLECEIVEN